ncbi:hypothetical protein SS50377_23383 [Spironucleus salmonicida]|uniref:Uncharacterized protein n=1 Tax=Spironucleus salmonicida TaxID=348837 RepID=V6LRR0_9EUKA|nr:hypothetical protein SS50377_23383 [Spironucleus salmonicida]|eukprot:EST47255.1 Hypothetical protein SS50377_12765 [Spironucleus salmonicida]
MKSLIFPDEYQPQTLFLAKDQSNTDVVIADQQIYAEVKGESLGTRAVYGYDVFGQLQFLGLVNTVSNCIPTQFEENK